MNERIRELFRQASTEPWHPDDVGSFDAEKFAKLIIEKCGDIANDYVDHGIPSSAIDRYFGI